jgi:putative ABC transport system permease protein
VLKLTLKNLVAHKRRLVGTFLAVVIGVSFFTGVTTLTATIDQTFTDLFSNGNKGTDAFIRSTSKLEVSQGPGTFTQRGRIDAALVDKVKTVDGVKDAVPTIQGRGRIATAAGKALGSPGNGPPAFAEAWISNPELTGWQIADGRAPQTEGEVVIDRGSAKDGKVKVGDTVTVQLTKNVQAKVVGIATYQGEDSSGGTTLAAFTLDQAERDIVGEPGKVDGIKLLGADGVSQQELVNRVKPVLSQDAEIITGAQLIKELQDDIQKSFLSFFNIFLTVFAVIAIVVAVFSIYNTFSIIVSQRAREMALLRAIGASRSQVLRSVLVEAFAVGVVASIAGVAFGLLVAIGLRAMLEAFGFGLPASSLTFTASTAVNGIIGGTLLAVLTGLIPALKATRIPPIAALRDVSVERTQASKVRIGLGVLLTGFGIYNVLAAGIGQGDNAAAMAGIGALTTLIGFVVLGPVAARPMSRLLGEPLSRFRGVTGTLARDNAMRNPRRTSGSAAALMIGVGIVALFTVFAASLKSTINSQIDKSFAGDLVIDSGQFGDGGISTDVARQVSQQPQVDAAVGFRFGFAEIDGDGKQLFVSDPPQLSRVLDLGVTAGSLSDLHASQIAVADSVAKDKGWNVGKQLPVRFVDGSTGELTIAALYRNSDIVQNYVIGTEAWAPHALQDFDALVTVKLKDGVSLAAGKAALQPIVDREAAGAKLQTRQEFRDAQAGQINQFVSFVYVMLAVAIIISLMGIANTLSLSINERIRELGLLRAVGMAREQLRATIRGEAVIIALFGTLGGLAMGVFFAWALVQATGDAGVHFALPWLALAIVVVLGGLAGVVSAAFPARRAARLNVLEAIAHE